LTKIDALKFAAVPDDRQVTLMKMNLKQRLLGCLIFAVLPVGAVKAQSPDADSVYVHRMMSLDRNADGVLDAGELPGKLAQMLQLHDANLDQKLDREELANVESRARQDRMKGANRQQAHPQHEGARYGKFGGAITGHQRLGNAIHGSPLDADQILRFALTFDADRDGGLNADELKRYANALAIRRAQGGRREVPSGEKRQPAALSPESAAPKGLSAPGLDSDEDPFASPDSAAGSKSTKGFTTPN